jgi:hypothetical protein
VLKSEYSIRRSCYIKIQGKIKKGVATDDRLARSILKNMFFNFIKWVSLAVSADGHAMIFDLFGRLMSSL